MARDITAAIVAETEAFSLAWGLLFQMNLDNGDVNLFTGSTDKEWDSQTWLGVGGLGDLSSGGLESRNVVDARIVATLSGIPIDMLPDLIEDMQDNDPTGRPWSLWLVMLDDDGEIIADPALTSSGMIDRVDFTDYPDASIKITLASEAARLKKSQYFLLNDADQDKLFSGDKGMEFAARLDDILRAGALKSGKAERGRPYPYDSNCIAYGMYYAENKEASEASKGDLVDLLVEHNGLAIGDNYYNGKIERVSHSFQHCIEIESEGGAILRASDTTPVTFKDGKMRMIGEAKGKKLATIIDGIFEWQKIIRADYVGKHMVSHIDCGGRTYAAGQEARARIFTHNIEKTRFDLR